MIKTLAKSIREYKKPSILSPIFVSVEVILECLMPLVIMLFIAKISPTSDAVSTEGVKMSTILYYGGILIAMALLSLVAGMLSGRFAARASAGFAKNLRKDMYYAIQDYSFANIDKFSTSSLVTRQTTDVTNVQMAYMMIIRVAIRCPLMLIFSLAMSFSVNVTISWVFLALVPVLAAVLVVVIFKTHPVFERVFHKYDNMNRSVREDIKGIRVVKSFVREDFEKKKFENAAEDVRKDFTLAERIMAINAPVMQFCIWLSFLLIYIYVLFVSCLFSLVLLFAVFAAVHFLAGIGQNKYLIQLLLNGGNAAGILTFDNIADFFRKGQCRLFYHFIVLYNIYCNIVIDKAQNIQIQLLYRAFYLDDVLSSHLIAAGVFDDGNAAVHLVQLQIFIDIHGFSGLDMIQHHTFV